MTEVDKRFWSKVDIKGPDDCWLWKRWKNQKGYGRFNIGNKKISAHRYAYIYHTRRVLLPGEMILHHCDNPACCNPEHLYCGTHLDNVRDMVMRGGSERITFSQSKFSAREIEKIREMKIIIYEHPGSKRNRYKFSHKEIAKKFNVNPSIIQRIWNSDRYPCKEGFYA